MKNFYNQFINSNDYFLTIDFFKQKLSQNNFNEGEKGRLKILLTIFEKTIYILNTKIIVEENESKVNKSECDSYKDCIRENLGRNVAEGMVAGAVIGGIGGGISGAAGGTIVLPYVGSTTGAVGGATFGAANGTINGAISAAVWTALKCIRQLNKECIEQLFA